MTHSSDSPEFAPAPLRARLGQSWAYVWRFRTLALAARLFADSPEPCVLRRPFFGGELCLDVSRSNTHRLLFLEGERFLLERRLVRSLLRPGMRVVDVGANVGYYLLLVENDIGPEGAVACFEPEPDNLVELRLARRCR